MARITESNTRYLKGFILALLSIALFFLGLWSVGQWSMSDNAETVIPSNYAVYAWMAFIGSFVSGCAVGAVLSPQKSRKSNIAAAGIAWFLASVAIIAGGAGAHKGSGPGSPCLFKMYEAGVSLGLYAGDNDDQLPSDRWMDRLVPYSNRAKSSDAQLSVHRATGMPWPRHSWDGKCRQSPSTKFSPMIQRR
jgi:peptidoglycan/LPS O-acetylase OafA/YrhL